MRSSQYYVLDSKRGFIFIMVFYADLKLWRDIIIKGLYISMIAVCIISFKFFFTSWYWTDSCIREHVIEYTIIYYEKHGCPVNNSYWLLIDSVRQRLWRRKFEKERTVNIHDEPSENYLWTPNLRKHLLSMNTKNMARCLQIQG